MAKYNVPQHNAESQREYLTKALNELDEKCRRLSSRTQSPQTTAQAASVDGTLPSTGTAGQFLEKNPAAVGGAEWSSTFSIPLSAENALNFSASAVILGLDTNLDDWAPSELDSNSKLLLYADAAIDITGIAPSYEGQLVLLANDGVNVVTFKAEDAGSTEENRFALPEDVELEINESITLWYDNEIGRWRCVGVSRAEPTAGGGGGGDDVLTWVLA